jgi:hypothetical protein
LTTLFGCEPELPGSFWDVSVVGAEDTCHEPPQDYAGEQDFEYRVEFEGSNVTLSIGEDAFATGGISGCDINYRSVVWTDQPNGLDVRWQLVGDGTFRPGGDACNLDEGLDWLGTETFEIIGSEDPDVEVGCTYSLQMQGTFVGTVE